MKLTIKKKCTTDKPVKGPGKKHAVEWLGEVIATKEEILEAFRAKYNMEPEEAILCSTLETTEKGIVKWYVKKKK